MENKSTRMYNFNYLLHSFSIKKICEINHQIQQINHLMELGRKKN